MYISTSGVLLRASDRLAKTRDAKSLKYPLSQLYSHLKMVKEAHERGESKEILDKFFGVWVDLDQPTFTDPVKQARE